MMFPLVLDLAAEKIPVAVTCRVLGFSKQAFYRWKADPVSQRDRDDAHLINAAGYVSQLFLPCEHDPGLGRLVGVSPAGARRSLCQAGGRLNRASDPRVRPPLTVTTLTEVPRTCSLKFPTSSNSVLAHTCRSSANSPLPGMHRRAHRESAIIEHPPGEETQFDWLELPDPPPGWGLAGSAHLLVGSLAHSSRWRAVLAESEDQPHLIEALDGVVRRLGGVTRYWRFDRMATVCHPGSGRVTASFAAVARHYLLTELSAA